MSDPKNVAHDKKVQQEKNHNGEAPKPAVNEKPKPGKKQPAKKDADSTGEKKSDSTTP
ncbi:hypothetical protein [Zavarzinella formosa]|uniref:hypothetical protein n=1 Tax=Zavarzinella formosa TaxID=360055 RepID=UPI0002DB95A9|nr:hypothetical protein [Zavarzinella formosa]